MALLNDLPNELLLQIIEYFKGQSPTLARVCRVSRKWKDIATDTLYTEATLSKTPWKYHDLVRRLLTHGDLMRHLKTLNVAWMAGGNYTYDRGEDTVSDAPELIGKCTAHIIQMAAPVKITGHLIGDLVHGRRSAFTEIALHLLPNLQKLSIRVMDYTESPVSEDNDLLKRLYGLESDRFDRADLSALRGGLHHLTHLCIPVAHFNLLRFFYLPHLRSLKLDLTDIYGSNLGVRSLDRTIMPIASTNGVEDLSIQSDCNEIVPEWASFFVTPHILQCLHINGSLNGRRHLLKRFEIQFTPGSCHRICGSDRSFQALVESLAPASMEIEILRVDLSLIYPYRKKPASYLSGIDPVTSLSDFRNLRNLEVPQEFLVHRNFRRKPHPEDDLRLVLPSSIEILSIICPDGMTIMWLLQLLEVLDYFKALRMLVLACRPHHGRPSSWFKKRCNPVFDKFRDRGIYVRIYDAELPPEPSQPPWVLERFDLLGESCDYWDPCNDYRNSLGILKLFGED